jgi:hypothetical protein
MAERARERADDDVLEALAIRLEELVKELRDLKVRGSVPSPVGDSLGGGKARTKGGPNCKRTTGPHVGQLVTISNARCEYYRMSGEITSKRGEMFWWINVTLPDGEIKAIYRMASSFKINE